MSTEKSEGRYSETCGAKNRNGDPCKLPAGWGTPGSGGSRCKYHGGASSGPKDTEYLEENDFAKGNPGGGAPEGNTNAETHGAWGNPHKVYERLEGESKAFVDWLMEDYLDRTKADLPADELEEKARELATYHILWRKAALDFFKCGCVLEDEIEYEGETYTRKRVNPSMKADLRVSKKQRELMRELRVYGTPDGLPWNEQ